jgi:outer membrane murein-binding lipoprotein Lpp
MINAIITLVAVVLGVAGCIYWGEDSATRAKITAEIASIESDVKAEETKLTAEAKAVYAAVVARIKQWL